MIPVSLLSAYLYCPRKVFLEKVLKIKAPLRESALIGTLHHKAQQEFVAREHKAVSSIRKEDDFKGIMKIFEKMAGEAIKNTIILEKKSILRQRLEPSDVFNTLIKSFRKDIFGRVKSIYDYILKHDVYGNELWERLEPKIKSEYKIESDALQLRGIIDQVHVYRDSLVPVELKTGRTPKEGIWPGHRLQLAAYVMLLEDRFNLNIDKGLMYYMDVDEKRQLSMNHFLRDEVVQTRIAIQRLLATKDPPQMQKNDSRCNACALKDQCYDKVDIQKRLGSISGEMDV